MTFITENLITILTTLFGGGSLAAYIFERKKNIAVAHGIEEDANAKEINNSGKVIDLYKNALDDLEFRYEKKYQEVTALYERKIKVLEDEIKLHKRMITSLKKEVTELRRQLKDANNLIK